MKFQGEQFLAGIDKSLQKLEQFNQKLKMQEGTKGLDNLGAAAHKQSGALRTIEDGVQRISDRFKTMGIVGMSAIQNVTNQAIFAGQNMVKSLSVEPIMAGFREYETNLNSIQTILSNTVSAGTNLKDVTAALDELNHYSDQTIYNFSEMARNIGTFTAAGVALKPAVAAIKGIANLAALSGSNSQQASTAMYQLSQAISAGRVSLEDWNSVVNAGMGGTVFQRALALNAQKMGTLSKGAVKLKGDMKNVTIEGKSFRESITAKPGEKSWLTSDVLTRTLAQFTGDLTDAQLAAQGFNKAEIEAIQKQAQMAKNAATQVKTFSQLMGTLKETAGSGWSQTWKLIFGDFEEAKTLFTNVNNVIGGMISRSADARNKLLADWDKLGGRKALIEGIGNAWKALLAFVKPIREAFRDIFPATTGKQLAEFSKSIRDFTAGLTISSTTADNLKRTFKGFFALLDIGFTIVKEIVGVIFDLLGVVTEGSGGFLEFTGNIGDWLVKVRDAIKSGSGLHDVFEGIGKVLAVPIKLIKVLLGFLGSVAGKVGDLDVNLSPIQKLGELASFAWSKVLSVITGVWDKMQGFRRWASSFFGDLGNDISEMLGGLDFNDILAGIGTGVLASIGLAIRNILGGKGVGGIFENISEGFENLTGALGAMQNTLRAATLLQIAAAVGILAISMNTLSKIDQAGLIRASSAITVMFAQLLGSLLLFEKFSGFTGFAKMPFVALSMILLAAAVDVLATAVTKLAGLDWNELAKGLVGTTVLIGALVGVMLLIKNPTSMISAGLGLIALAAGIRILVKAVTDLSGLSWEELGKGLIGVGGLLLGLGLFTKFAQANKTGILAGAGLLLLAAGIKILASAVGDMAGLSWAEIGRGLVAMAGSLALATASLMLIPPTAPLAAASVLIVAVSLGMVAKALEQMGKMSWGEIGKSLTLMLGALTIITAAVTIIPPTAPAGAAAVLIVALSLGKIGDALERFSKFSWGEILKAGVVLAGSLGIIAGAMILMSGALPGAAALLVVTASLAILAPVLTTLGGMSWGEILKGLVALAGALTIIGIAGLVLTPVIPSLIGLGAAITLLGAGLALAGAGVFLFATGLALLAASGGAATVVVVGLVTALIGLIPMIVKQFGVALVALADVIVKGAPAIGRALMAILNTLLDVIDKISPKIINVLLKLLTILIEKLAQYVPRMVDAGARLVTGVLNGMAKRVDGMVTAATNLIVAFINSISKNLPRIIQAGVNLIINFVNGIANAIRSNSDRMNAAGRNLASAIVEGMVSGIRNGIGAVVDAARTIAKNALSAAKAALGIHSPSKEFEKIGKYVNDGFRKGLDGNKSQIDTAFKDLKAMVSNMAKESSKDIDALEAKLKKLNSARKKDRQEIKETKAALAQANKEHLAAVRAQAYLTAAYKNQQTALGKLATQYDTVTAKLEAAKQTLADAIKTRDDYNKQIREQFSDLPSATGETKLADYLDNLKKQIADTKTFANAIQRLRSLGLNDETYQDLLSSGTSALPFMQELLAGGKASVDQLNQLGKELDTVGTSLGKTASSQLYQAAVDSAAGLVKGLQNQQAAIEKQMDKIADSLVNAIKKKLGIKSPSKVFAEIGSYSAQGLVKGLDDNVGLVGKSAENIADKAVITLQKSLANVDKMVGGNLHFQPVVRPVLDLTDIQKNASKIDTLLPTKGKLTVAGAYSQAVNLASAINNSRNPDDDPDGSGGSVFNYTQNNYSPKALTTSEIYRKTKNQVSTVKEALST